MTTNREDPTVYEPKGVRFYEAAPQREMLLINEPGHPNDGWLCWRHPDGQWVTERKATDVDRMQIASARDRLAQKRDPLREPITEEENLRARLAKAEERARRAEQALGAVIDAAAKIAYRSAADVEAGIRASYAIRALAPPPAATGDDLVDMPPDGSPIGFRHNPDRPHPCDFACGGTWVCTLCGAESSDSGWRHECATIAPDEAAPAWPEAKRNAAAATAVSALSPPPAATETPEGASHE